VSNPPAPRTGIGAQLRTLRRLAGLSQEALAEKAGVSVNTVAGIEDGQRRRPHLHTLRVLADALNVSAADRATLLGTPTPEPASGSASPYNGPRVPPSQLIGREEEIAAARARLSCWRLLTLVGPGGVGKTRLAVEIEATVHGDYADGAAFVDLAPLRDPRLVASTFARMLGLRDSGGRSPWELLCLHLRARRVLLVLDNFEHLLSAAPLLTELLATCPDLTLLVTSRTALRLRGEYRQSIGPLATPAEATPARSRRLLATRRCTSS
jgi:transcriptional regulator with XRE-family HTH domain